MGIKKETDDGEQKRTSVNYMSSFYFMSSTFMRKYDLECELVGLNPTYLL